MGIILLCGIVPVIFIVLFVASSYRRGIMEKTESMVENEMEYVSSLISGRLNHAIEICKAAYDEEYENAWREYQIGKQSEELFRERVKKRLEELIRLERFELVHCHGSKANLMGVLLKRRIQVPVITTIHSDPKLDYLGRPLSNLTYGTANRAALRHLDDWICVSGQLRDMLLESGADPKATFVINNGVDFSNLHVPVERDEFWKIHGLALTADSVVFGVAARISPVKDIGSMIRAFSKAWRRSREFDWPLPETENSVRNWSS